MPRPDARSSRKLKALQEHGALHLRPQDVTDPLFHESAFFDVRDIVQVKYEMLRRVRIDERQVSETAAAFGLSRPSFYAARRAFEQDGLPGLLPQKRGPRRAHKLTDEVLAVLAAARTEEGAVPRVQELAEVLKERFGITAHPRSIERSLQRYRQRRKNKPR